MTIAVLLAWAPLAQGQTNNDTPDPAVQTRTTIPGQHATPENRRRGLFDEPSFITKGVNLFDRRANRSLGNRERKKKK